MLPSRGKKPLVPSQSDIGLVHHWIHKMLDWIKATDFNHLKNCSYRHPYSTIESVIFLSSSFSKVTKTPGLRPVTKEDFAGVHTLLQANLRKFHLSPILSLQEVEHWLLPRENVIDTYVVEVKFSLLWRLFSGINVNVVQCCSS